jgi:hypothetical protein
MIYFVLLLVEILVLFLLSKAVSKTLSRFVSINLLSFLFSPGVIVHELSHLFAATILFVPVGHMEFSPKKEGNGVKLGSIEIAKTDPIRRSLIGCAPFFVGFSLIVSMVYFFNSNISFLQKQNYYVFIAAILSLIYLLFAISNTMFSSKADMEGTLEILITIFIILGAASILGFRLPLAFSDKVFVGKTIEIVQRSAIFLLVPIVIDFSILGVIKLFSGSRSRTW